MSKDKFTPGPWVVANDSEIWSKSNCWIADLRAWVKGKKEQKANAELIASAPTLHAENKELKAEVERWKRHHDNMKERCAVLRERHDLPVDRIPAYEKMIALQAEVEVKTAERKAALMVVDDLKNTLKNMEVELDCLKSIVRQQTEELKQVDTFLSGPIPLHEEIGEARDSVRNTIKLGEGV